MSFYERTKAAQAARTAADAANERESSRHLDDDLARLGHPPVALANLGHGRLTLAEASALGAAIAAAADRAGLLDDLRAVLLALARHEKDWPTLTLFGVQATVKRDNGDEVMTPDKVSGDWSRVMLTQRDGSALPSLQDPHATAEELARRMVRRIADALPDEDDA